MHVLLPTLSTLVGLLFAGLVLDQWRRRRHPFQLVWAAGLLFYAMGAGAEAVGGAWGWSPQVYRAWYFFGAFLTAAWLGLGTVYLLRRTGFGYFVATMLPLAGFITLAASTRYPGSVGTARAALAVTVVAGIGIAVATAVRRPLAAHLAAATLGLGTVAAAVLVMGAPIAAPGYAVVAATHVPVGSAMPGYLRVLTPAFNVPGALCLIHGAVFSAYVYMPKRKVLAADRVRTPVLAQLWYFLAVAVNLVASLPGAATALVERRLHPRVGATILIAFGAVVPSLTTGLNRLGLTWAFFAGELVGLLLIFAGFLVDGEVVAWRRRSTAAPLPAGDPTVA